MPVTSQTKIPVAQINYGEPEIQEVLDSLRSGQVTMGAKVRRFEELWAAYIGVKHAIMVNSGRLLFCGDRTFGRII